MGEVSSYYSNVNADLLAAIPPDCRSVLEVGCGTGALASRYKLVNPRCEYWGVEVNAGAAAEAANNPDLDNVIPYTIERALLWLTDGEGVLREFSCFVFGDVLEHLVNPHQVIKGCRDYLEDGGSIVACIPNIAHYSALYTILNGDWPLHDAGLFDATHLRNFTKKSIVDMFEGAGMSVAKIKPRRFGSDGCKQLVDAVEQSGLVSDVARFREEIQDYQYVVHAVKGEVPARKVLVRGFAAEGCCARPRLTEPGAFINTIPGFRYSEVPTKVEPGEAVIVVRQRFNITEDAVRTHLKNGCLIVGEWDDDPWYEGFKDKLKVPSVEWALKACHAIRVSTMAIADLVRPINPNVHIAPNEIAAVGPKREYVASDVVRVYMGGQRKREDWEDAVKVVNRIVAANPDRYDFVVAHDRDLYEALETKRKTFYAFQPYEKYRALLRTCHVALLPTAYTRFNRCKSDISWLECSSEGVAWAVRPEDIKQSLEDLHYIGSSNQEFVADQRMLAHNFRIDVRFYNDLIDRKDELDRQLFERLPELKEGK